MVTYHVVLSFAEGKNGVLIADPPREVHGGAERCIATARRLAESRAGVIAFARTGDPQLGDWDDAVVLWQSGLVPEDAMAAA